MSAPPPQGLPPAPSAQSSRYTTRHPVHCTRGETGLLGCMIIHMTDTQTAGQKLVELLDTGLPNGVVWKASERATLQLISDTADRVEVLKALLAAEVKSIERSTHRCAELAGEIRMAQAAISKMIASLDPEMVVQAKSARHQSAAHTRWSGAGLGGR